MRRASTFELARPPEEHLPQLLREIQSITQQGGRLPFPLLLTYTITFSPSIHLYLLRETGTIALQQRSTVHLLCV